MNTEYSFFSSLGPMVYSTSYCPLSKEKELKELGFAGQFDADIHQCCHG